MWTKQRGAKNLSNYFSVIDDIGEALKEVMNKESDCVFGLEMKLRPGVTGVTLVTPSFIRLGKQLDCSENLLLGDTEGLAYYEGYLVEPNFLPLYGSFKGVLMNNLSEMYLEENEFVEIQWLFRKRFDDWRDNAIDRYSSYLEGNDYPVKSRFVRGFQDTILKALNKVSSLETARPYNEEVEEKILDEAFQFQMRIVIRSQAPESVRKRIEAIFSRYDSHNALRLYKRKPKGFKEEYLDRVITADTDSQILSRKEMVSLFGGEFLVDNKLQTIEANEEGEITRTEVKSDGLISLLPEYHRKQVEVDEGVVTDIAEALKRVGLVKQARLSNHSVTAGIRLTVAQCSIPKGRTLTQLINKAKDIQAALGVPSLSIEQGNTPDTVKFTLPNKNPSVIGLRELMEDPRFHRYTKEHTLPFIVGVDEINEPIYLSLGKLVHLLIAGTTGSGKSVFMNTLILCLLATYTPEYLRMFMIDPKMVELGHYKDIPHVEEVITDMKKAEVMLVKLVTEMDKRYATFQENGVKNIALYNQKSKVKMPYIVCVIDEYADLHDTHPEVEDHIIRLGQKARAAGIHMVIATQRPSADILSSRIKANVPNAISFNLSNNTNYKTVFGKGIGTSFSLLGKGDGIMKIEGYSKEFQRFQSAIVSPDETKEEKVFKGITEYFSGVKVIPIFDQNLVIPKEMENDDAEIEVMYTPETDLVEVLKGVIARTGETKVDILRKEMGIKATKLTELMGSLVEEGWLIRHSSKAKGYEVAVDELTLARYKNKN